MGIEDRDYFRERKFSWTTGELIEPDKGLKPLEPLKPVPVNPIKFEKRQIKTSQKHQPPDIPKWITWVSFITGACLVFLVLHHWN